MRLWRGVACRDIKTYSPRREERVCIGWRCVVFYVFSNRIYRGVSKPGITSYMSSMKCRQWVARL